MFLKTDSNVAAKTVVRKGGDNREAKRTPLQQFSLATPAIFRYGRMVVTNSKSCRRV